MPPPPPPLTIVTNLAAPYRDGLFRELHRLFELKVYLLAGDEPGRRWRRDKVPYPATYVPALQIPGGQRPWYCALPTWLRRDGYIIVAGFGLPTVITALVRPRSTLLWSEATHITEQFRGHLRTFTRKWLVRRCLAAVASGRASAEYLHDLGARQVVLLPNVIDTPPTRNAPPMRADDSDEPLVLAHVGDWSIAKGADVVAKAFKLLASEAGASGKPVELLVAGNIIDVDIPEGATHVGYLPHSTVWDTLRERGAMYLLLMSRADTWGFVVPEAVAAGLIPIASPAVGCGPDLLSPVEADLIAGSADDAVASIRRFVASPHKVRTTLGALQLNASSRTPVWAARRLARDLAGLETIRRETA